MESGSEAGSESRLDFGYESEGFDQSEHVFPTKEYVDGWNEEPILVGTILGQLGAKIERENVESEHDEPVENPDPISVGVTSAIQARFDLEVSIS